MTSLCLILLVGIVSFVQGDPHYCDPFAINVKTDPPTQRTGPDANNQELDLATFLAKPKISSYLTHASPSDVPGASEICTGPTHGADCDGVEYAHILDGEYEAHRPEMLKGVRFKITLIGYDRESEHGVEVSMIVEGANKDDFIFEWVEGTDITAYVLDEDDLEDKTKLDIDPHVLTILKSPFALYSTGIDGYALWVTCDGLYSWATYPHGVTDPNQDTLKAAIETLIKVVKDHRKVDLAIDAIADRQMPKKLSDLITALVAPAA